MQVESTSAGPVAQYDVLIAGGSLSGTATAYMLLQRMPDLKVLVVERKTRFTRRVGESTVEISSLFLSQKLGLAAHLQEHHISKQGLRFWFQNESTESLDDLGEVGPKYLVRFPGYQVDRAVLDEHMLEKIQEQGATVWRGAQVVDFSLNAGGVQQAKIRFEGKERDVEARWLVDATGGHRMVARRMGWVESTVEHPISSVWCRFRNVLSWDSEEIASDFPEWRQKVYGLRNNATNHLTGPGWWCWWIPLKGGDVSIGLVYDERIFKPEFKEPGGHGLLAFLREHPAAKELLKNAEPLNGDVHRRHRVAWRSRESAQDGCLLVGDAAGFIDPFYSPGMDWICFTSSAAVGLIEAARNQKEPMAGLIQEHQRAFQASYKRWFEAIYQDKYYYMGDYELMRRAFPLDLGFYYLGVLWAPFMLGYENLKTPAFGHKNAAIPYRFIRGYNRWLARLGRLRMAQGRFGEKNDGRYYPFKSYELGPSLIVRLVCGVAGFALFAIAEEIRAWTYKKKRLEASVPATQS